MRIVVIALAAGLAGCSLVSPGPGAECHSDSQCGDDVCARNGECLPRTGVRELSIRWTLNGEAADPQSCAAHPNLYIRFDGPEYDDTLRLIPVVCSQGSYIFDKLPRRYQQVELGFEGGAADVLPIDAATAQIQFDLIK
jgi:hypothetical protein